MRATDPAHEAKRDAFDHAVETLAHHQAHNGASEVVNLTEAAKLVGVSRGRLYRAIETGRLDAMPGGGPGKPTMVSREALHTFCQSEGLQLPDTATMAERSERTERSMVLTSADTEHLMERLADQVVNRLAERFTGELRAMLAPVVEDLVRQSTERLSTQIERAIERLIAERPARRPTRSLNAPPHGTPPPDARDTPRTARADVLARLRAMQAEPETFSTRKAAERLNAAGIPTTSGRGRWTSGQISRLLQDAERSASLSERSERSTR